MKKLLLIIAIAVLFISCSSDSNESGTSSTNLNYSNLILEDVSFYKENREGQSLQVTIGEPVTVFTETSYILITNEDITTNNVQNQSYYKQNNIYYLPNDIEILFWNGSNRLLITTTVQTDYGFYQRKENYSYGTP